LPRKSGFDVLAEMKSNPHLRHMTVVVFSTSNFLYDREESMELGADHYLHKNGEFEALLNVARSICEKLTANGSSGR
jgi:CheY-like chemotaxis protein